MTKIVILDAEFQPYDYWKNFADYVRKLLDIDHCSLKFNRDLEFIQRIDQELKPYNARFLFLEMSVEFQTEQDATLFLLKWS